jgi:hypothetical protein
MNTTVNGRLPITPDMQARLAQISPEQRARIEDYMNNMASGIPKTISYKSCVKKENLDKYPFAGRNCTYTVLSSTGTKMDVHGVCILSEGIQDRITAHLQVLDPEHVQGDRNPSHEKRRPHDDRRLGYGQVRRARLREYAVKAKIRCLFT